MLAEIAKWSLVVFGWLVLMGGVMGWVKAKSKASLISAIVAQTFLVSAFAACIAASMAIGLLSGAAVTLLLTIVFIIRFYKTKKFMPSGLMILLSLLETILLVAGYKSVS